MGYKLQLTSPSTNRHYPHCRRPWSTGMFLAGDWGTKGSLSSVRNMWYKLQLTSQSNNRRSPHCRRPRSTELFLFAGSGFVEAYNYTWTTEHARISAPRRKRRYFSLNPRPDIRKTTEKCLRTSILLHRDSYN